MSQIIHATQELITDKDMWEPGATDGTREHALGELRAERCGVLEQDEDIMQVYRRRRARRAAGGAIAGMMAAKRAVQQISIIEANGFPR